MNFIRLERETQSVRSNETITFNHDTMCIKILEDDVITTHQKLEIRKKLTAPIEVGKY